MDWLNYHHLFYFWMVVREGSIAAASRKLLLSPATISAQLRDLENALGERLFRRAGRNLVPTDFGRLAARYADEIFGLGQEFMDIAKGRTAETSLRFRVGVDDVVPKLILARLLEPAFNLPQAVRLVCVEGTQAQLLPQLAVSELDVIISDAPADPAIKVRAFSHLLGQTGVTLCAAKALARRLRAGFPQSLDGAPALLPTPNSSLRRALDEWFDSVGVRPQVVAEFEDLALLNACGHRGAGFFPAPDVVAHEITAGTGIRALGRIDKDHESLYAISVERRIKHPAALALLASAKNALSPAARRGKAARARGGRRG